MKDWEKWFYQKDSQENDRYQAFKARLQHEEFQDKFSHDLREAVIFAKSLNKKINR